MNVFPGASSCADKTAITEAVGVAFGRRVGAGHSSVVGP